MIISFTKKHNLRLGNVKLETKFFTILCTDIEHLLEGISGWSTPSTVVNGDFGPSAKNLEPVDELGESFDVEPEYAKSNLEDTTN